MIKMLQLKRIVLWMFLLAIVTTSYSQQSKVNAAYTFLQNSQLDSAKVYIDAAVFHPETSNDGQAWYLRGFVYKSIYNQKEKAIVNQFPV